MLSIDISNKKIIEDVKPFYIETVYEDNRSKELFSKISELLNDKLLALKEQKTISLYYKYGIYSKESFEK